MRAMTIVTYRGGEVTSLSRPLSRSHTELCALHRRGWAIAARNGIHYATTFASSPSTRGSVRACSSAGEAPKQSAKPALTISIPYRVNFGEVLRVVGSGSILGDWAAERGLQLTWTEGDVWTAEVPMQAGHYEFKCVVYNQTTNSVTRWEEGGNRILNIAPEPGTWQVSCQWGATAAMTQAFIPAPPPQPPSADEAEPEPVAAAATTSDGATAGEEPLPTFLALSEAPAGGDESAEQRAEDSSTAAASTKDPTEASSAMGRSAAEEAAIVTSSSSRGNAAALLLATCAAAGAVAAVAFLTPAGVDTSGLGGRAGKAVGSTLLQSSTAGEQVRAQVQAQLATLAGHMSAVQPAVRAQMASVTDGLGSLQPMVRSGVSYMQSQATALQGQVTPVGAGADAATGKSEMGARVVTRQG